MVTIVRYRCGHEDEYNDGYEDETTKYSDSLCDSCDREEKERDRQRREEEADRGNYY